VEEVYIKGIIMCYVLIHEDWYDGDHEVRLTYRCRGKKVAV
jgi:hypothetical protein